MTRIWLDTNFIVYCLENKVSLVELVDIVNDEIEIIIASGVLDELNNLGGKFKSISHELSGSKNDQNDENKKILKHFLPIKYSILTSNINVDDFIYKNADKYDIVCTHDKKLISKLRANSVSVINISKKGFVLV